jgi:hypothetical protein
MQRAKVMAKKDTNPSPAVDRESPKESHDMDHENMGEHEGATEDEVSDVPAPAGTAFEDEPRQG